MSIAISCNNCKKFLKDYGVNKHVNVSEDGRYLCDKCYEKEKKDNDKKILDKVQ